MAEEVQETNVILFADIVGSTSLYETLGNAPAKQAVDLVLAKISNIAERRGGTIVKYIGDEMLCRFGDADEACYAAVEMQEATVKDERELRDLKIKIGMGYGPVILESDDVFGNAVNIAARMAAIATAGQIITTEDMVDSLNKENQLMAHVFDRATVRGKAKPINLVTMIWETTEDVTTVVSKSQTQTEVAIEERLLLSVAGDDYAVGSSHAFYIGRGMGCDLAIPGAPLASRKHASIEFKRGQFVLVDRSTNGTWIRTTEGNLVCLRREELKLWGQGVISLGSEFEDDKEFHIHYRS